jgi:hypothetical protein
MDRGTCEQAITATFEEAALALGGVVATYQIPDEAVWEMARLMDVTHRRIQARCCRDDAAPPDAQVLDGLRTHPAIAHLLQTLDGQTHRKDTRHDSQ